MSQIYKSAVGSSPSIPTQFTGNSGTATPAGNNINFFADDTIVNDDDGLNSIASGDTVTYLLTNRGTGQVNTTTTTTTPIVSFTFGADGSATFQGIVTARKLSNGSTASWNVIGSFSSTGGVCVEIGSDTSMNFKSADLVVPGAATNINITFTAIGNAAVISVIGIAGVSINWDALITYRLVQ